MCSHGLNRKKVEENSGITKPEYEQRPNKTKVNITWSHWELKGKTRTLPGTRKNAGKQVVILAADWLRGWCEFIKGPMETKINVFPSTNQIQHRDNVGNLTANLSHALGSVLAFALIDDWLLVIFLTLFWLAMWSRLHWTRFKETQPKCTLATKGNVSFFLTLLNTKLICSLEIRDVIIS